MEDRYISDIGEISEMLSKLEGYSCLLGSYSAGRSRIQIELNPPDEDEGNNDFYELTFLGVLEFHMFSHSWVARGLKIATDQQFPHLYRLTQHSGENLIVDFNYSDVFLKHMVIE